MPIVKKQSKVQGFLALCSGNTADFSGFLLFVWEDNTLSSPCADEFSTLINWPLKMVTAKLIFRLLENFQ